MSYLVLARKWRPKRFAELVGQEHVVRALSNALTTGRVHHAFLFTGTRGIGKTTIARLFAKSLNCERGVSAEPCGRCTACCEIDAGRFIDLLEIDAASNTGVDDVREVIDNAQYLPTRGAYKVYLIDEVHMLSKAAFNALLKTLEEPPAHVKFLLATTDPQKLPMTVLSRCLQFNLRRLDPSQISAQLTTVLTAEGINAQETAIQQLAKAADGSMRDALSLLDQAIAYSGGDITDATVLAMLGGIDRSHVTALLTALSQHDGRAVLQTIETLAEFSPDWETVLEALSEALHSIQKKQLVPDVPIDDATPAIIAIAAEQPPEVIQLWYQMATAARRELTLAPTPRMGFEMTLFRMLAFNPLPPRSIDQSAPDGEGDGDGEGPSRVSANPTASTPLGGKRSQSRSHRSRDDMPSSPGVRATASGDARNSGPTSSLSEEAQAATPTVVAASAAVPLPVSDAPKSPPPRAPDASPESTALSALSSPAQWFEWIENAVLEEEVRRLAIQAAFIGRAGRVITLGLDPEFECLGSDKALLQMAQALEQSFGLRPELQIQTGDGQAHTYHQHEQARRAQRHAEGQAEFIQHPIVQQLIHTHHAHVVNESIHPYHE